MIQYPGAEKKEKVGNECVENKQLYKEKVVSQFFQILCTSQKISTL